MIWWLIDAVAQLIAAVALIGAAAFIAGFILEAWQDRRR